MCKLSLCLLVAIFGCLSASSLALPNKDINRDLIVVEDVRDFTAKHPGLKLQRLEKQPTGRAADPTVRYSIGGRTSGDTLVAQGSNVFKYASSQDISMQLTYPESGAGAIVTFVELSCTQDNTDGNAFIVAGGVGQRFISIVVEAKQTQNFAYQAQYFGLD